MPPCFGCSAAKATLHADSNDNTATASAFTLRMVFLPFVLCMRPHRGPLMAKDTMARKAGNRQGRPAALALRTKPRGGGTATSWHWFFDGIKRGGAPRPK